MNQTHDQTLRCRTGVATVLVVVVDTQMGTMTIPTVFLVDILEVEIILQPIPTGMNIHGLEVAV